MSTITETICCCFLIITRRDEIQLLYLLRSNRTHETWQSWSQYSTNKCDPRFNIKFPFSSSVFVINIRTGYCTASQVSTLNKFSEISEIFSALDALVSDSVLGRLNVSWHGEICRAGDDGCVNMVISLPCLLSRRSTIIVFTPETCSADLTLVYMIQWLETDHWSSAHVSAPHQGAVKSELLSIQVVKNFVSFVWKQNFYWSTVALIHDFQFSNHPANSESEQ